MSLTLEDAKQTMIWITSEINIVLRQIDNSNRYPKARHEGYLNALKKVQAKLDGHTH